MNMQFDPRIDHYKVLGVKQDASADEIKKAYRRLAKQYHPDSTGGDKAKESRFKEIGQAYDVLGDPEKRAQYDAIRAGGVRMDGGFGGGRGAGPAGFDLNDLFSQMFRGGRGAGEVHFAQGGPFGGADPFGFDPSMGPAERVRHQQRRPARARAPAQATEERKVRASDGSTILQRGGHVYSDVRVNVDQAILGTVVEVATLTGKAKVKIPPGTSSGVKLRLKGKGPAGLDGQPGDHFVTVQIDVPKKLDEKAKKLLIELMQRTRA